jgi:AhpD family alkylhydroperoxidase
MCRETNLWLATHANLFLTDILALGNFLQNVIRRADVNLLLDTPHSFGGTATNRSYLRWFWLDVSRGRFLAFEPR